MSKRWKLILVGAVCGLALPTVAIAGYHHISEVVVRTNQAYGSVAAARNSSDNFQYIGCGTIVDTIWGGGTYGQCTAEDRNGVRVACRTTNPEMMQAMATVGELSFISFVFNSSGTCTYVYVTNASNYLP